MFDPVKWRNLTVVSEISPVQISVHYLISFTEAESFITGQEPALSTDYEYKCEKALISCSSVSGGPDLWTGGRGANLKSKASA